MRLLITGASGLLGFNVALDASRAHEVTGVVRTNLVGTPFAVIQADLLEPHAVERVLETDATRSGDTLRSHRRC